VTVLVTGAGGFVGSAAVRALEAAGQRVIAARRPGVDVLDPATLAAAMPGVETVVHCAVGGPRDTATIVEGTRNVLSAARAAGVARFVQLSSVAVYGPAAGRVDEDAPTDRPHGAYGAAKVAAERLCREVSDDMAVAILRPSLIYGPRSRQWTTPYLDRLASGRWPALGAAGEGDANLIHVDDLAGFIAHIAGAALPVSGVFNVNGADIPTWNAYLEALRVATDAPAPTTTRVPGRATLMLRKAAKAATRVAGEDGALGRFVAVTPSADEVERFRTHVVYAIDRMIAAGYRPRIDVAEAVAGIAEWDRAGRP
jgi:UDP-glucose 4-epimerase